MIYELSLINYVFFDGSGGSFQGHSGIISGSFQDHSGSFRDHSGVIPESIWGHSNVIPGLFGAGSARRSSQAWGGVQEV